MYCNEDLTPGNVALESELLITVLSGLELICPLRCFEIYLGGLKSQEQNACPAAL